MNSPESNRDGGNLSGWLLWGNAGGWEERWRRQAVAFDEAGGIRAGAGGDDHGVAGQSAQVDLPSVVS